MAIYFFHLLDGDSSVTDGEGRELADQLSIPALALAEARAIIAEDARSGRIALDQYIVVESADGRVVHRLPFEEAIEIIRGHS